MKRDLELIRNILLNIESSSKNRIYISDLTDDEGMAPIISLHIELLLDCNYLEATPIKTMGCHYQQFIIHRMTSQGYDYLDNIRDEKVWQKTKSQIGKVSSSVSLEVIKTVSSKIILGMLGI